MAGMEGSLTHAASRPEDRGTAAKAAVVTGAASGIGRAVAARLAQDGIDVLAVDLHPDADGPGTPHEADLTDAVFDVVEALTSFATERGVELLDVAIGGLAGQPSVASVIAGATSRAQVERNVRAGSWTPTPDDLAQLEKITTPPAE